MADELSYRKDLFAGTAGYYDRFRPPYPPALLDDLRAHVPLTPESRMLDLACGTGQIAFAMAAHVAEVVAVDQEEEAVELAAGNAKRLGLANVRWIASSAEVVALDGVFDLAAIGNAFHRLDRDIVARRLARHSADRGCVALLWSGTPWSGERPWQLALHDCLEKWKDAVGARDRVPRHWEQVMKRHPHEHVLRRAGFSYEGRREHTVVKRWTIDSLLGFMASTSFLNQIVLGRQAPVFERDLRSRLGRVRPDGVFEQDLSFAYELARRIT